MRANDEVSFWANVAKGDDGSCWPWTGTRIPKGYGYFSLGGKKRRAHRLAWVFSSGPIPTGLHVLHRCDNPPCVNPAHLFLGTNRQNVDDMLVKGRSPRSPGVRNGRATITESAVREIRDAAAHGESQRTIARRLRITDSLVSMIVLQKIWKHAL